MKALVLGLFVSACAQAQPAPLATTSAPPAHARPTITLVHGSAAEKATRDQLERLFDRYDLGPWLFTRSVAIDEESTPHSHPILTLHTRHLRDDVLLLSTFIHEESHWYATEHQADVDATMDELHVVAPNLPVGFPDGAQNEKSSYEHLIVIALEERGLQLLVGELAAREAMLFWSGDHYRVVYRVVLDKRADVWRVMRAHRLASPS